MADLQSALLHAVHRNHTFSEYCSGCMVAADLLKNLESAPASPQEDPELFTWLRNAMDRGGAGGSFLKSFAEAAFRADDDNYRLLRPIVLVLKGKYPKYSEVVDADRS